VRTGSSRGLYNYDPLGRLDTTSSGGEVTQKQRYDGFDRTASTTTGTGSAKKTKTFSYDPFDRTTREKTSGDEDKTTAFTYLGITSKSLRETVSGDGADSTSSFQYAPWGQKLTQIKDKAQTAYPHCQTCARMQGGVVSQLAQGKSKKEW
jgi:YD repeat-containing protein